MASIYDFIQAPARPVSSDEQRRRELLLPRIQPSPTVATPMWNPISAQPTPVDRAQNQAAPSTMMIEPSPTSRLEDQRRKTRELQDFENNPVQNNDRGWKGRLLDIGRQFLISAGQTYDKSSGEGSQRLLSALGGGIAGGVYGGFHPEVDEERQRLYDIGRSQQLEGEIEGQIQRDQQRVLTDARITDIPEDRRIKELQIQSVERSKALAEIGRQKKFDPNNQLDRERAIRAGMNPDSMVAFDDRDPKTVKLGNDVLQYNRTTGKFEIAGTRGDMVEWKLGDKVYRIPADKAAYNDTMLQLGAERVASNEKIASARLALSREQSTAAQGLAQKQFDLAMQKYNDAKDEASRKEAVDLMQDALKRVIDITESYDMSQQEKDMFLKQNQDLLLKAQRLGVQLDLNNLYQQ